MVMPPCTIGMIPLKGLNNHIEALTGKCMLLISNEAANVLLMWLAYSPPQDVKH